MTTLTNEELLVWLINEYMPPRSAEQALAALAGLRSQTPPQAVTDQVERRDDLHSVIARIMQQPIYNSSAICDGVEQYLDRLSTPPTVTLTKEDRKYLEFMYSDIERCHAAWLRDFIDRLTNTAQENER